MGEVYCSRCNRILETKNGGLRLSHMLKPPLCRFCMDIQLIKDNQKKIAELKKLSERNRLRVDELKDFRHHMAVPRIVSLEEVLRELINVDVEGIKDFNGQQIYTPSDIIKEYCSKLLKKLDIASKEIHIDLDTNIVQKIGSHALVETCPICDGTGINTHIEKDELGIRKFVEYPCQCQKDGETSIETGNELDVLSAPAQSDSTPSEPKRVCLLCGEITPGKWCPNCTPEKEPTPSCETCKEAKIIIGFEQDPICTIDDGIECARKGTWRSYQFNENKVNFSDKGLEGMVEEIKDAIKEPTEDKYPELEKHKKWCINRLERNHPTLKVVEKVDLEWLFDNSSMKNYGNDSEWIKKRHDFREKYLENDDES